MIFCHMDVLKCYDKMNGRSFLISAFQRKGTCGPTATVFGLQAVKTKEHERYMSDHAYCFVFFPE